MKILKHRYTTRNQDGDYTATFTCKLPKGTTRIQAKRLTEDFFYLGCSCSFDCCGHYFSRVWTHKLVNTKRQEWIIEVDYQRNI